MSDVTLENLMCHRDNLENVLDNLKEGIIAHDMQRRIFFFNKEAERITGYSRQEVLGRDCHEAFGSPFCGEHCVLCNDSESPAEKSEFLLNLTTKTETGHVVKIPPGRGPVMVSVFKMPEVY